MNGGGEWLSALRVEVEGAAAAAFVAHADADGLQIAPGQMLLLGVCVCVCVCVYLCVFVRACACVFVICVELRSWERQGAEMCAGVDSLRALALERQGALPDAPPCECVCVCVYVCVCALPDAPPCECVCVCMCACVHCRTRRRAGVELHAVAGAPPPRPEACPVTLQLRVSGAVGGAPVAQLGAATLVLRCRAGNESFTFTCARGAAARLGRRTPCF